MNYTLGNKELEFNVKLGTTVKIKKAFNKQFNEILKTLDKLDIDDLIKLLYCGLTEEQISKEDFTQLCYDNIGLMELYDAVQMFIKKIQYPGLTIEEIDKKIEEKNLQAQKLGINMTSLKD